MTENFNALIREALVNSTRKIYLLKLLDNKLTERNVKPSYLTKNKTHKWAWAYSVCKAFDIPGDIAYKALLADKGLSTDNIKNLIKDAPDCFLCGYAFYGLRVQQLLTSNDNSPEEKIKIIKYARTLANEQKKIISFLDAVLLCRPQQREVLFLRFCEMNTCEDVTGKLNYSVRWVGRLQQSGLKNLSAAAEKYDK